MNANLILTYRQLITQIVEFNRAFPGQDILDQPVTFSDPQDSNSYYDVTNLKLESDGHCTMEQRT